MSAAKDLPVTPPLDWRRLNLDDGGRSLIEASAGTGKTWTIAVLYLRLLLERQLSPRQIVVTTFTDAAAQELRERLRGKLQWAVLRASDGAEDTVDGSDGEWLLGRWQEDGETRVRDLQRLRLALAEMDVAPISTLHSLCRRILADHPFACGVAFMLGDMVASESLLDEVAGDLWRRLQQGHATDELVLLAGQAREELTLHKLGKRLHTCLAPGVSIEARSEAALDAVLEPAWAARLRAIVTNDAFFTASCSLRNYWSELADLIDDHSKVPGAHAYKGLRAAMELKGIAAKMKADPELIAAAAFSERCTEIFDYLREHPRRQLWRKLTELARAEMQARLAARHQMTFDSLIESVSSALLGESASAGDRPLAEALFKAWPVALVDEFQDTDGQQYGILDAIYRQRDGSQRGRLVMIGDPKQAIYRFRGGDIHAYQRAAAAVDADGRLTLATNHRSSAELVAAFNQFYAVGGKSLDADDSSGIAYEPVRATDRRAGKPYSVEGKACSAPLVIHYLRDPPPSQPARRAEALQVCANQIAALLQSRSHRIGGELVQPSDLAVLLPTGADISHLRDALRERGVPCVTSSRSSVFDTDIARELQIVLYAMAFHTDLGALRAAAATRLWGASFSELQRWGDDVAQWQPVAETFRAWSQQWSERGILHVVGQLIDRLAARYLETMAGERVLTDLRHLGELLQTQSEQFPGTEELLAWFAQCRDDGAASDNDAADAAQLRIESDSARVRLMTLHASKGLEFPIVFLPLMWNHGERASDGIPVVNDPLSGQRTAEFSAAAKAREAQDLQDERFRVLYVALTRAIHACHVFALPPDRAASGRSEARVSGTKRSALDVMLERIEPVLFSEALQQVAPNIHWITGWQPTPQQNFTADAAPALERRARSLPPPRSGPLEAKHSFTTLTHGDHRDAVNPGASAADEDEAGNLELAAEGEWVEAVGSMPTQVVSVSAAELEPHADLLTLAAVRGTDFGNAVHAMFEHRDVGQPMSAQRELIEDCLRDAGVRRKDIEQSDLVDLLVSRIQAALDAPLGIAASPSLCLADLAADDLRAEMGFYFSLERVSMARLRAACANHGEPDLVPASQRLLSGLMNGKIDLIFQHDGRYHVLDYKGNYLGETLADYQGEALRAQMDASHYRFQALLYTVAVDRYLRQRLGASYERGRQLGECIYLFIRAAGLAADAGIWRHRFPDELLDAVGAVFADGLTTMEAA
ncbi:UvrD-helicase domain-containing protein [Rhodanobacter sp. AS-Z3]|uniref:UvrD-helicase domain-containing protein n=1 Tax=Rhodanobacter sp. AS-Z3 TaxID=3031330 RepID=UPI00247A5F4E|nr:UvrD-helicase domain-containing protein [Rhodanobacter sp. AS-Z3]WEN15811.1 UvrD-helicase domain-containing protein [Rhodanobacter sp. AS-Z3]